MTNHYNKFCAALLMTLVISWFLPSAYDFVTEQEAQPQFVIYSDLVNDFLYQGHKDDTLVYYSDRKGNTYEQYEADSLLPCLGYPMLMMEGRLGDTILGKAVDPSIIQDANFFFEHSPADYNAVKTPLYSLLESQPKRIVLAYPNDIFRLKKEGIEFIDMNVNAVDSLKSKLFTQVMMEAGLKFPILKLGGNPTPMKDYDEGYVLCDSENKLFHLKMVENKPFIKLITKDLSEKVQHIYVTEYPDRRFLAFVLDVKGQLHSITQSDYTVKPIELPSFDPKTEDMIILGNLFSWTVEIDSAGDRRFYAIDNDDLSLLASAEILHEPTVVERVAEYLFAFQLKFESPLHKYFEPEFSHFSLKALPLNLLLLCLLMLFYRQRRKRERWFSWANFIPALILMPLFGLFALIPCLIFFDEVA